MPIYEYCCEQCETKFETLIRRDETAACPDCGSENVRRLLSACGFVSKGAGGETVSTSAGSSCSGCAASSCASCGV
jgi:putative FmdB family regulatory protein